MWPKLFRNRWALATAAGIFCFLPFPKIGWVPLIVIFPIFFTLLTFRCERFWQAFGLGFYTSFVVMAGGFHWVIFVLHEFGYLPWWISALLYLGFCGFGALNFPLFVAAATWLHRRIHWKKLSVDWMGVWFTLTLPAFYVVMEFLIPKLFPWYTGHCFYIWPLFTQISEITGSIYLSFAIYSTGSFGAWWCLHRLDHFKFRRLWGAVPLALWLVCVLFGWQRLSQPPPTKHLHVALIQANIGSLEKVAARKGIYQKVHYTMERYEKLTEQALAHDPPPDLIFWPETAVPFQIESQSPLAKEIRDFVVKWKTPLVTGAYAPDPKDVYRDYNAGFLLEPQPDGSLAIQVYLKNILLAFGEYMPFGEAFPKLYKYFPQVSNFARGQEQQIFTLKDGSRLGMTICYEAIVPSFFRKVTSQGVVAVANLTNDSWFGPTAEPYSHAALAVFRTVENRVPLIRVTNTGISFTVDDRGRMSPTTGVYEEGIVHSDVLLPDRPPFTFYLIHGDWFIWCCGGMLLLTGFLIYRKGHVSLRS